MEKPTQHEHRHTLLDTAISVSAPDFSHVNYADYRQHYLVADIAQWRLAIMLLAVANLLFSIFDFSLYGVNDTFLIFLTSRLLLVAYSVWLLFYLAPNRKVGVLDALIYLWVLIGLAVILLNAYGRPQAYFGHYVFEVFAMMVFFTAMPLDPLKQLMFGGLYLGLSIPILFFYKKPPMNLYTGNTLFVLVLAVMSGYLISERIQRYRLLAYITGLEKDKLARTDPLTGLANRRAFMEWASEQVKRSQSMQQPLTLLMMDIDHFKSVNDRYGHAAGDQLLIGFAQRVRMSLQAYDFFARLGGEEFVLALPGCNIEEGCAYAEQLIQRINATPFSDGRNTVKLSLSIGVSSLGIGEMSIEQSMKRADAALYTAKGNGRNRVERDDGSVDTV